ncbi:MAG: hypothetical protein JSV86_03505 [Gemmatimonadota bacterium]|nr:MAG: hypothetical protein JSV86_03505 [Gemmatimonadota bacterium]
MTGRIIWFWVALLLLPLVPVTLLYYFFSGQNYFELKDVAKGIVATGPIAAYVAIVFIGWKIFRELPGTVFSLSPAIRDLPGQWTFRSESSHGTVREGSCQIVRKGFGLVFDGNFREAGKHVGDWKSEIVHAWHNRLFMFYELSELKADEVERFEGVSTLTFGTPPISQMSGTWNVVGKDKCGTIVYSRA